MRGKAKLQLSILNVLGVAVVLGLLSSALMNGAYGQAFTNNQVNNNNFPSTSSLTSQKQPPKLHLVKITSPVKGQQVSIGKDLEILGTSKDNATTTPDCKVSVKLNSNSYRDASASGSSSQTDYSNWKFTLTPSYANINEGQNKITAKFSCINNPSLLSHNSVNVTGIAATSVPANNDNGSSLQEQVSSAPVTPAATPTEGLNPAVNGTTPVYSESTANNGNNNSTLKAMSVTVSLDKNSLHPGNKQTVTLSAADKDSSSAITGASVSGNITGPSGLTKKVEGTTDDSGKATYSWIVGYPTGKYKVKIELATSGYENYSGSETFNVTPIPVSASNDNSDNSDSNTVHHTITIRTGNDNSHSTSVVSTTHSIGSTSDKSHHNIHHNHHSAVVSSTLPNSVASHDSLLNDHASHDSSSAGSWINPGISGLVQKIINDVKSKLEKHGIPIP
jgi:hypothetical protein